MKVLRTILGTFLAFAAITAEAAPSVLVETDPIRDVVTSTVKVDGEYVPGQKNSAKPRIRVVCMKMADLGEWIDDDPNSESLTYQTVVRVDLPGSNRWNKSLSGVGRFDKQEPFNVNMEFSHVFEGFTLEKPLAELVETTPLAIRVAAQTAIFELTGLRGAMLKTSNKCAWDSLNIPSTNEA